MSTTIRKLPILTKGNREKYLDWHKYYEKVYKKRVTN